MSFGASETGVPRPRQHDWRVVQRVRKQRRALEVVSSPEVYALCLYCGRKAEVFWKEDFTGEGRWMPVEVEGDNCIRAANTIQTDLR